MSELVGEELGNFHIDFSMDNANTEIYAIESLFLGKKTYIDILESTDKDGKTINSEHIIMKGIPTPCIKYYAQKKGMTVLDVFKKLFKNKAIKFDLMVLLDLYVETTNSMQYQMYQISLGNANTSEMKVISSLLIDDIVYVFDYV